ncbi:MAG: tetratricopeptide repeat protein, partial [Syntrophales bacterium]
AIKDYGKAIAINKNYADAYYFRGLANYNRGQYDKAIEDCSKLWEDYDREVMRLVDNTSNSKKTIAKVGTDNEALHNLATLSFMAVDLRGRAHAKKGQYEEAIRDYNIYIEMITTAPLSLGIPRDRVADAYHNRGFAYSNKRQYGQAIDDYNKAIAIKPRDAVILMNRGVAYIGKGQYDLAVKDYDSAVKIDPIFNKAYVGRGVAYAMKGNMRRATSDFRKACEMGDGKGCEMLAKALNER